MKTPPGLQPLIDDGVIDEVLRSLKSGKEATVYVVRSGTQIRCAKVYRDMAQRSFQKRAQYQEGRKVRGSRQARAIGKSTRFGRKEQESAWKNTEVDALYQLVAAGVRVPKPFGYFNGVLVMELVTDAAGDPAPRLGEVELTAETAREYHALPDPAGGAHAVHRADPRRPVGVQRAGRARRPGDHRPAAGGQRGRQQRRVRDARAGRQQLCGPRSAASRRSCSTPNSRGRCGHCSSRASCGRTASSRVCSRAERPSSIRMK